MKQTLLKMSPKEALLIAALIVGVMGVTIISFEWVPHLSILLVLCGLMMFGGLRGIMFNAMRDQMASVSYRELVRFICFLLLVYWCRL